MSPTSTWFGVCLATLLTLPIGGVGAAVAQGSHQHTAALSGAAHGIPIFCAIPTVTSVASGAWSNPSTWSTKRLPGQNDKVVVAAGHAVRYDAVSDAALTCLEVRGHLAFATSATTRIKVVNLMVFEEGHLEVGSASRPVVPDATAEIVIADQAIDATMDPEQFGTGIIALGKITMHGARKTPTFIRLTREPLAGSRTLDLEKVVTGWKAGDDLVIPDTRQLRANERGGNRISQDERLKIASIAGSQVTLAAPLAYDHRGARNASGDLEFLPHVGNISRNVIVRSENPRGTRGHTLFISHSDIDLRYAAFRDLGRTKPGALNSVQFDTSGRATKFGTNQIGRYAVHFHHNFGPKQTPANGHQFTLIGNAVDSAEKWGVTVHNSHYGLIQDNVVYNARGAGIVTEDGTESFNVFDHNFSIRCAGSSASALAGGYGGAVPDLGGEGASFWFRGPNNYIRNNVAANGDELGFGLAALSLSTVRIPAFKGANTSTPRESVKLDTTVASVLEFVNNEAYGAMQTGVAFGWSGIISQFTVWHPSRHGIKGIPADKLVVDKVTVRGDSSILTDGLEDPVGVWLGDYASKSVAVHGANVQGMRVGVSSPFFYNQTVKPGRSGGSLLVDNSYFRTHTGVSIATAYAADVTSRVSLKTATVRSSVFEPLDVPAKGSRRPATISMNYGMAPNDPEPRDPILVYDYNKQPGHNFKVYYSHDAPKGVAPCHDTLPDIDGWVCK